jgi:probable selenium-dependent hydroxylase accessory protein YqeC
MVTITGGGGKTSLMFSLVRHLKKNASVIVTTTTKICRPYPYEMKECLMSEYNESDLLGVMAHEESVIVGDSIRDSKLIGIAPQQADMFFQKKFAEYILVEGDGSQGLPFKAYEDYEPVIPSCTTSHIVVIGSEILFSPLSVENVFRFDLLKKRWKLNSGEKIPLEVMAKILQSASEYLKGSPGKAIRILIFNKYDLILGENAQIISEIVAEITPLLGQYDVLAFTSLKYNCCYELINLKII